MADRTGLGRRLAKVRASVKANAYVPLFKYEDALLENKVNYDRADVLERERDTLREQVAALRKDAERLEWATRESDGWGEFVSLVAAHWTCDGMPKPWIPYVRNAIDERMRNESEQDAALADKP